jgi:hypothetical protein
MFLLCSALAALLLPFAATAEAAAVPVEGEMLVSGVEEIGCGWTGEPFAYFIRGSSSNVIPASLAFTGGRVSPHEDEVVYMVSTGEWPDDLVEVWVANLDGSEAVNVSGLAGLGGLNCAPQWSPDGSKIAFHHCDPVEGILPCDVGFHAWVMNADGTDAHRVLRGDDPPTTSFPIWSPNGYRLLMRDWGTTDSISVDIDGGDAVVIPNIGGDPDWSRDGLKIVSTKMPPGEVDGEPGVWHQLVVTNADGSDPQVLVEQFLSDADVQAHLESQGCDPEDYDWVADVQWWAGPVYPQWSPRGDRVAFLAALPFDPTDIHYKMQVEIWVCDLDTEELSRVTQDTWHENSVSWDGHNTYPYDTEVTVENTTVNFDTVTADGLTTILRDVEPPDLPGEQLFTCDFRSVTSTAGYSGPISICMTYEEADCPAGPAEDELAILHWDGAQWVNITTSRDPVNNTIYGQTDVLSPIALQGIRKTEFTDVPAWGSGADGLDPHWAYFDVMACVEAGIVAGYADGLYRPDVAVTRDQMAVYISRALAGGDENVPAFGGTPSFPDVDETHWALDYVEYAVEQNVVAGYADGTYHPEDEVTRDQMAVYVARALVAPTGEAALADYVPADPRNFPDVASDFWAHTHIEYCVENGVAQGYEDGYYHPEIVVTRDQMAVYVARAFGSVG